LGNVGPIILKAIGLKPWLADSRSRHTAKGLKIDRFDRFYFFKAIGASYAAPLNRFCVAIRAPLVASKEFARAKCRSVTASRNDQAPNLI
jgi:hypothetical protein